MAGRWLLPHEPRKRNAWQGNASELLLFLASVPAFAIVANLLWVRLALDSTLFPGILPPHWWQALVVIWFSALVLLCAHTFLAYLGRTLAGPEESLLYLQDQLWSATRGEQRRINRWLVWARLRAQRKEEQR